VVANPGAEGEDRDLSSSGAPPPNERAESLAPSPQPAPSKGFADVYRAWRCTVAEDDLDVGTATFDALRDTSIGPDVKL
jgi:hypothetical protein